MKNKKGLLLPETNVRLFFAVLGILLLSYVLLNIYSYARDSRDLELAKSTLSRMMGDIKAGKTRIDIYNPEGWQVSTWSSISGPKTCSNLGWQWCVCICKENTAESCDENGICLNNEKGLLTASLQSIEIEDPPITLDIDYTTKKISKHTTGSGGYGASGGYGD